MKRSLYVSGALSFHLDGYSLSYQQKEISIFGVSGLPWHPLKPKEHFGTPVLCRIKLDLQPDVEIVTRASITREQTQGANYMGLRFIWDDEQRALLQEVIAKIGHLPNQSRRKFPRIPFRDDLEPFPAHARIYVRTSALEPEGKSVSCDIVNLSPDGLMVRTGEDAAANLRIGGNCVIMLEPRGTGHRPLKLQVSIRRLFEDLRVDDGKLMRSFGLQLLPQEEETHAAYRELLRDILLKLQSETKA